MPNTKFSCCTLDPNCTQIPEKPKSGKKIDERTTLDTRIGNIWFSANGFKQSFSEAYNRLTDVAKEGGLYAALDMQTEDVFAVCAVNGLFATELYFKMIYAYDSLADNKNDARYYGGHKLDGLFCALSCERKRTIINHLTEKKMIDDVSELCGFLSIYKNDFVEWRYIFEAQSEKNIRLDVLKELLDILSKVTREIINTSRRPLLSNKNPQHSVGVTINVKDIRN